jgi:Transposase DDE domain/Domain of unknown function (DUF4372)
MSHQPTRARLTILQQVCNLIPPYLVAKLAREHGVDKQVRKFSAWSHVVALLYAQLTHALSLNDICDALTNHAPRLLCIRNATPPRRNTLSNANHKRSAKLAEDLFWSMLEHLQSLQPGFGGRNYHGLPRRFKRAIHVVDATVIQLVANCLDWARHRRRKAAAKLHLRLNLQSFLPNFVVVDTARENDNRRAREVCAGIAAGEIAVFDKAYYDFEHLADLHEREVSWVTRAKENMQYRCWKKLLAKPEGNILRDDLIVLTQSREKYPETFRRIEAWVEVDGEWRTMVFITNNLEWAPGSIVELYRCRWSIETFFKQIKQTLQLCDFLGHSKNAILWQIWTALLLYVLLRFLAYSHKWTHSFRRLFCVIRAVIWDGLNLRSLLQSYGTAGGLPRTIATPEQAWLPGLEPHWIGS